MIKVISDGLRKSVSLFRTNILEHLFTTAMKYSWCQMSQKRESRDISMFLSPNITVHICKQTREHQPFFLCDAPFDECYFLSVERTVKKGFNMLERKRDKLFFKYIASHWRPVKNHNRKDGILHLNDSSITMQVCTCIFFRKRIKALS